MKHNGNWVQTVGHGHSDQDQVSWRLQLFLQKYWYDDQNISYNESSFSFTVMILLHYMYLYRMWWHVWLNLSSLFWHTDIFKFRAIIWTEFIYLLTRYLPKIPKISDRNANIALNTDSEILSRNIPIGDRFHISRNFVELPGLHCTEYSPQCG